MEPSGPEEASLHAQEPGSDGFYRSLCPIAGIQFCDDVLDVLFCRYFGDEQASCDGLIGKSLNQQFQHIHLPGGQRVTMLKRLGFIMMIQVRIRRGFLAVRMRKGRYLGSLTPVDCLDGVAYECT